MLITTVCPKCGGQMEVDDSRERVFCTYCGTEIVNMSEKVEVHQNINVSGTVTHKIDKSSDPNLYIDYQSSNAGVQMIVRVVSTGKKYIFLSGRGIELFLPEGPQQLVLKIGKINYNRTVYIQNGQPVRIYATWSGHANINIEQPEYFVTDNGPNRTGYVPTTKPWYKRWWVWFLAVLLLLIIIGLISKFSNSSASKSGSSNTGSTTSSSVLSTEKETTAVKKETVSFREYDFALPYTWHVKSQEDNNIVISLDSSEYGEFYMYYFDFYGYSIENDSEREEIIQTFLYEETVPDEGHDEYWVNAGIPTYVCTGSSNDEYGTYKIGAFADSYHGILLMKMYIAQDESKCIDEFNDFLNDITVNNSRLSQLKKDYLANMSTYYEICTGYYTAGVDLPVGKMNITVISGRGTVHTSSRNGGLNEMMGISDTGYYITTFNGVSMDSGVVLDVSGTLILAIEYTSIDAEYSGRKYNENNAITLSSGNYVAGTDFPAGIYTIVAVSGRGTLSSSNMFTSGVNEMFGIDDGWGYYTEKIVNVELPEGATLEVKGLDEIKMIPQS